MRTLDVKWSVNICNEMLKKTLPLTIIIMHRLIFGIWDVIHYAVWLNVTHFVFRFPYSCSNSIHSINSGWRICRQLNIEFKESTPNVERRWIFKIHSITRFFKVVLMFSRANSIKYILYLFSDIILFRHFRYMHQLNECSTDRSNLFWIKNFSHTHAIVSRFPI